MGRMARLFAWFLYVYYTNIDFILHYSVGGGILDGTQSIQARSMDSISPDLAVSCSEQFAYDSHVIQTKHTVFLVRPKLLILIWVRATSSPWFKIGTFVIKTWW